MERSAQQPRKIGRYEIEAEIGRGMMGVVYKANDPLLHRTVALKVIELAFPVSEEERQSFEKRFLTEGRIIARLSHPGIVMVHDVGRDEELGRPYLALEFLVGQTLEERLESGQALAWDEALRIGAKVARALRAAHDAGVVHRDVKPANIMILERGEPRVMDFGVARLESGHGLTHTGHMVGTPLYMSPEQALGESVDGRSDLFSLASVLYAVLTGQHAFAAESVPLIMTKVAYDDPPPASTRVPSLPSSLDRVLERALQKSREARYPDGDAFADDLEDVLAGRPPRHLEAWSPPARTGTGTLVAASPGTGTAVATPPAPAAAPPEGEESAAATPIAAPPSRPSRPVAEPPAGIAAPRRRSRWPLRLALLALAAGLAATHETWRPHLERLLGSDEARALRDRTEEVLESAAREAGERGREVLESAVASVAESATPPLDEPTPEPDPGTLVSEVSAETGVPGAAPGRLSVSVRHPAGGGRLRLTRDGLLLFDAPLLDQPAEPALLFRGPDGGLRGVLPVPPGAGRLRVTLDRGDAERSAEIDAPLAAGQSRHLEIDVGADGSLALEWR